MTQVAMQARILQAVRQVTLVPDRMIPQMKQAKVVVVWTQMTIRRDLATIQMIQIRMIITELTLEPTLALTMVLVQILILEQIPVRIQVPIVLPKTRVDKQNPNQNHLALTQ
jgi:hypothetical protein